MSDQKETLRQLGICDVASENLARRLEDLPRLIADNEAKALEEFLGAGA